MCGITAVIDSGGSIDESRLRAMTGVLRHRGPDDAGFFFDTHVGLGHRRLSVLDVQGGHQPIHNEDRSLWVILNGEIYNHDALRKSLQERGHVFYTRSDTEVIPHLYEEYGDECVQHLRGMFAFVLWDKARQRLLAARDRLGKKPLFYARVGSRVLLASEPKALLQDPDVPRQISWPALDRYLTFGYIPAPETIYHAIDKLLPGHLLTWEKGELRTRRYWELRFSRTGPRHETEALAALDGILRQATQLRTIADVAVGAFLSGGVDSSLVVALMCQVQSARVKTFSIGFRDQATSELGFARRVSQALGTEHNEIIVDPHSLDIVETLVDVFDEPFADSSMIPTYEVARQARRHVTVALTGDGGDEVFAGYTAYRNLRLAQQLDGVPGMRWAANVAQSLVAAPRWKRRLQMLATDRRLRHQALSSITLPSLRRELYTPAFAALLRSGPAAVALPYDNGGSSLSAWQHADLHTYLPDDILVKVDRAAMAVGLETRAPLLDQEVVQFMATLPDELKLRQRQSKYLLKKLAARYVPRQVVYRPKQGFSIPAFEWFRGPERHRIAADLLSESAAVHDVVRRDCIARLLREHGRADHSRILFALWFLELWMQRHAARL